MVFRQFWSKPSGRAPNRVIMGDRYAHTPCGDFWTDSGTFVSKKGTNHGNAQEPQNRFGGEIENPRFCLFDLRLHMDYPDLIKVARQTDATSTSIKVGNYDLCVSFICVESYKTHF